MEQDLNDQRRGRLIKVSVATDDMLAVLRLLSGELEKFPDPFKPFLMLVKIYGSKRL